MPTPALTDGTDPLPDGPKFAAQMRPEIVEACAVALRRMDGSGPIGVTSSVRGEGRSTVAGALAVAAAQQSPTILVELDFEHPSLADTANLGATPGVAEFLRGEASIGECLQRADDDLEIMVAGLVNEPIDALVRQLPALMAALQPTPDPDAPPTNRNGAIIIADLPALESGVAAARIADVCTGLVLVVRAGGIDTRQIEDASAMLAHDPLVILNRIGTEPKRKGRRQNRKDGR